MTEFETKDSGVREEYDSGMRRDTESGKPRFDLLNPVEMPYEDRMLTRWAALMGRGADKYGDRNWEKGRGQAELDRAISSAFRHFMQWVAGQTDEDHASAVFFNIQAAEYFKWRQKQASRQAGLGLHFEFDSNAAGRHLLQVLTGDRAGTWLRGDVVPPAPVSALPPEWRDVGVVTERDLIPDAFRRPDLPQAPVLSEDRSDESDDEDDFTIARAQHRAFLQDWHNRPVGDDIVLAASDGNPGGAEAAKHEADQRDRPTVIVGKGGLPTVKPGPPATPEDRAVGQSMQDFMQEKKRLTDWMWEYGDEIVDFDGFPDLDTYALITRAEYLKGLALCTMKYGLGHGEYFHSVSSKDPIRLAGPKPLVDPEGC